MNSPPCPSVLLHTQPQCFWQACNNSITDFLGQFHLPEDLHGSCLVPIVAYFWMKSFLECQTSLMGFKSSGSGRHTSELPSLQIWVCCCFVLQMTQKTLWIAIRAARESELRCRIQNKQDHLQICLHRSDLFVSCCPDCLKSVWIAIKRI